MNVQALKMFGSAFLKALCGDTSNRPSVHPSVCLYVCGVVFQTKMFFLISVNFSARFLYKIYRGRVIFMKIGSMASYLRFHMSGFW